MITIIVFMRFDIVI